MKVLVIENNLMWSSRIRQTLLASGHEVALETKMPSTTDADIAIVNLSSPSPFDSIRALRSLGIKVLAHAGHKETELWEEGERAGATRIASNGTLTHKLPEIIAEMANEG